MSKARRLITIARCRCGAPVCRRHTLEGIGMFYLGSGFSEAQAARIAYLINNDPDFPLEED